MNSKQEQTISEKPPAKGLNLLVRPLLIVAGLLSIPFLLTAHKSPLGLTFLLIMVACGVFVYMHKRAATRTTPKTETTLRQTQPEPNDALIKASQESDSENIERFKAELKAASEQSSLKHILLSPFYILLALAFIGVIVAMDGAAYIFFILATVIPMGIVLYQRHKAGRNETWRGGKEFKSALNEAKSKIALIQTQSKTRPYNLHANNAQSLLTASEYVITFLLACILMTYLKAGFMWAFTNGNLKVGAQAFAFGVAAFVIGFIFSIPYLLIQQTYHPHKTQLRVTINIVTVCLMALWVFI